MKSNIETVISEGVRDVTVWADGIYVVQTDKAITSQIENVKAGNAPKSNIYTYEPPAYIKEINERHKDVIMKYNPNLKI